MQSKILVCLLSAVALTGCASASSPTANLEGPDLSRARAALARLGYSQTSIQIIQNEALAAYSYSTGSIILTQALIEQTSDDQLAAVLAHELGHLNRAPTTTTPSRFTLNGPGQLDQEQQADDFACRLLLACNIPITSLTQVLTLVRDHPHTQPNLKPALTRRITRLP